MSRTSGGSASVGAPWGALVAEARRAGPAWACGTGMGVRGRPGRAGPAWACGVWGVSGAHGLSGVRDGLGGDVACRVRGVRRACWASMACW